MARHLGDTDPAPQPACRRAAPHPRRSKLPLWTPRLSLLLLMLATSVVLPAFPGNAEQQPSGPLPSLPRVDVATGPQARFVTPDGREVLLRAVNVNQLGDYYAYDPHQPTVFPLTQADFAGIAAQGFDAVRLVVSWSALEPKPGAFDLSYVERIRRAVRQAAAHGLWTILDMHQDSWGKDVATAPGETCPPGLGPAQGWDGAPSWASRFDGMTRCRAADKRELSPAVAQAWTNFFADRDGIQTALVATWARLAAQFAAEPAVAGYDLINEPHPGLTPAGPTATYLLGRFYDRAITAIRQAESTVRGGFPHIAFFEPTVLWSGVGADGVPPPGFTSDRHISFAPHLYNESITLDAGSPVPLMSIERGFDVAQAAAAAYGIPLWSGEWGWFGPPATDGPRVRRYVAAEDARVLGGAWWVWKQACGDPHTAYGLGGGEPVTPGLNRYACPGNVPAGMPAAFQAPLSRAYPRLAPGLVQSLIAGIEDGSLDVSGTAPDGAGCGLEAWVPDRGQRALALSGTGLRDTVATPLPGGWLVRGCAIGAWSLQVRAAAPAIGRNQVGGADSGNQPSAASPSADARQMLAATGDGPTLPTGAVLLLLMAALARRNRRRWDRRW